MSDAPPTSDQWVCVYCDTELADEHSACCGEIGHTKLKLADSDVPPPLQVPADLLADADLWVNPQ